MLLLLSVATWLAATHPHLEEGALRDAGAQGTVSLDVEAQGEVTAGVGSLLAVQSSQDSSAADRAPWVSETRELDSRARRKAFQSHFLFGGALVGGAGAVVLLTTF